MRRLSAMQVAAVTAATAGVWGLASDKLRIPVLALAPIVQDAHAVLAELAEVIVTSTAVKFDVKLHIYYANGSSQVIGRNVTQPTSGGGQSLSTQQKLAQKCALSYSKGALPNGKSGPNPIFHQEVNTTHYGWGADPDHPELPSPITTLTLDSPGEGYDLINANTQYANEITIIYERSVAFIAAENNVPFKQQMVRTLVHEWYHQWFGMAGGHQAAYDAAEAAVAKYVADGQSDTKCQTRAG